jgi:hypothetical protein
MPKKKRLGSTASIESKDASELTESFFAQAEIRYARDGLDDTTQLERILDGLPQAATLRFFATFARFEYALMQSNYLRDRQDNSAQADWNKLVHELGNAFFAEVREVGKASVLISDPPKRPIVRHGRVEFGPAPPPVQNTQNLFVAARQVRNNLFHGSKLLASNRRRDVALMTEVIWLLDYVMEKLPSIKSAFREPQHG